MTDHDEYEWVLKDGLTKKNLAHADIPIANAFRNVLCFLMLLTLLSACSKDDDSVDPAEIGGKFGCFEGEQNGEIFKLPEDGFGIDIQINRLDEKNATVEIIPYGNKTGHYMLYFMMPPPLIATPAAAQGCLHPGTARNLAGGMSKWNTRCSPWR